MKFFFVFFSFFLGVSGEVQAICVNQSRANLRSRPSVKATKTWEVYKYMPFRQLRKKGDWIQVKDVDGAKHWIHSKLVSSRFRCAVVKVKYANLRVKPSLKAPQSKSWPRAEKYASFKVLDNQGKWTKLMDEYGDKYWVYRSLIWVN